MAANKPDRPTSFAKSIDLDHQQKSVLDRALKLKEEYLRAHAKDKGPEQEKDKAQSKPFSPPPLQQHLRPDGSIRRAVDRNLHKAALAKDRAKALSEAYKARHNHEKGKDLDKEQDRQL